MGHKILLLNGPNLNLLDEALLAGLGVKSPAS